MNWSCQFSDFDEMAENIADWSDRYEQISCGAFRAKITISASPSIEILTQSWNLGLSNQGAAPRNRRSFAFPVIAGQPFRFNGAVAKGAAVLTARGGKEYHLLTAGTLHLVIASFAPAMIDARLRAHFACEHLHLDEPRLLAARSEEAVIAAGRALDTLGRAMAGAGMEALAQLEERAADIVLSTLALPSSAPALTPRVRLARRIEDVLRDRLSDPPRINELCRITGAPERTLHLAFQEAYGHSPAAYLRRLRLNAVRRVLLEPGGAPVTAAATRFGFFHFGRFAADYRQFFGDSPSETARRRGVAEP
ncbi:helix-turn-helix domain-containing protein [Nostoc sp. NIES-2111]